MQRLPVRVNRLSFYSVPLEAQTESGDVVGDREIARSDIIDCFENIMN